MRAFSGEGLGRNTACAGKQWLRICSNAGAGGRHSLYAAIADKLFFHWLLLHAACPCHPCSDFCARNQLRHELARLLQKLRGFFAARKLHDTRDTVQIGKAS